MKSDEQLQRDVMAELEYEPRVDHSGIGVSVTDGIVALSGFVESYAEKLAAEEAARRVAGVRALTEQIKVRLLDGTAVSDHEIARQILSSLAWDASIPDDTIAVKVENGLVTLSGTVDWHFQAKAACNAAAAIKGVTGVVNLIKLRRATTPADVCGRIRQALSRSGEIDDAAVSVTVDGHNVTLGGRVKSWHERTAAENIAWSVPGVRNVDDKIVVES